MTDIKITKKANSVVKVSCTGHAETVDDGEYSMICAGLSTLLQTALLGLLQVAKIDVKFERCEKEGKLEFSVPEGISETKRHDADVILNTLLCGLTDLYEGYSDFIKLQIFSAH